MNKFVCLRAAIYLRQARCARWAVIIFGLAGCLYPMSGRAASIPFEPGKSCFGRSNYVEYLPGTLPIIFSAPHGGTLTPSEIPNRVRTSANKDFVTSYDGGTRELAMQIRTAFYAHFGEYPHVVICHLRRTKVDCNRDLEEGTGGNPLASRAWMDFQEFITMASNTVVKTHGFGFYVDLHGHGNPVKRLELGYLLKSSQLTNSDAALNAGDFASQSSVRSLAERTPNAFSELLRGPRSLGALLAQRGFPAVPSPRMPSPGNGVTNTVYPGDRNAYFRGGYNTRTHTSVSSGGPMSGVQIEANYRGVRDNDFNRAKFARSLAEAMDIYFREHYGRELKRPLRPLPSPKEKGN